MNMKVILIETKNFGPVVVRNAIMLQTPIYQERGKFIMTKFESIIRKAVNSGIEVRLTKSNHSLDAYEVKFSKGRYYSCCTIDRFGIFPEQCEKIEEFALMRAIEDLYRRPYQDFVSSLEGN